MFKKKEKPTENEYEYLIDTIKDSILRSYEFKRLNEDHNELRIEHCELKNKVDDFVECDTCGCLLKERTAFRGQSTVAWVSYSNGMEAYIDPAKCKHSEEVIVKHYYCKIHKPENKTTNEHEIRLYPDSKGIYSHKFTEAGKYNVSLFKKI